MPILQIVIIQTLIINLKETITISQFMTIQHKNGGIGKKGLTLSFLT